MPRSARHRISTTDKKGPHDDLGIARYSCAAFQTREVRDRDVIFVVLRAESK
jgi:hypothetical protein